MRVLMSAGAACLAVTDGTADYGNSQRRSS